MGPANYRTPEQTKEISLQLSKLDKDFLKKRFDPSKMNQLGIYPDGIWSEEMLEYLIEYFDDLKAFYAIASKNNEAIISFLS